ncbi:hypothetical protein QFZ27_000157 [Inquilinus ginsengisoli]
MAPEDEGLGSPLPKLTAVYSTTTNTNLLSMALPSELDLWRTAQALVKQHGERAPEEARKRAERFAEEGRLVWLAVASRCEELLQEQGQRQ